MSYLTSLKSYVQRLRDSQVTDRKTIDLRWQRYLVTPPPDYYSIVDSAKLVANEHGFESWDQLLEWHSPFTELQSESRRMHGLLNGSESMLEQANLERFSLAFPLARGLRPAQSEFDNLDSINSPVPPLNVPPIVYACCSSIDNDDVETIKTRRKLVEWLLQEGADPNTGLREATSVRGFLTCLGGAVGRARDSRLVSALLDAGADPADGPTLYEGSAVWEAVRLQDLDSLRLLCEVETPEWIICHALTHSLQFKNEALTRMLLEHGADPNWNKTVFGMEGNALHEAVQCRSGTRILELIVEKGGALEALDAGGRTPLALCKGQANQDLCAQLEAAGARTDSERPIEMWVGHLKAGDLHSANELATEFNKTQIPDYHDNLWLVEAVIQGDVPLVRELVRYLDVNVVDYEGHSSLHRAVQQSNQEMIKVLLAGGAAIDGTNFDGDTPVDIACRTLTDTGLKIAKLLADHDPNSFKQTGHRLRPTDEEDFEVAADAIANGDIKTLARQLEKFPYFNRARSRRAHRCTLMNYVGVNGFESERQRSPTNAVDVIELLIGKGCDPNALCYTYRGGPGQTTVGLFTSSGLVPTKEQNLAMLKAMVKGGAVVSASQKSLLNLLIAQDQGELDKNLESLDINSEELKQTWFELFNYKNFVLLDALLEHGMDVNVTNDQNQTALHWAAYLGDEELVDWLLSRNAVTDIVENQFGGTPASWANEGGHSHLVKRLS